MQTCICAYNIGWISCSQNRYNNCIFCLKGEENLLEVCILICKTQATVALVLVHVQSVINDSSSFP